MRSIKNSFLAGLTGIAITVAIKTSCFASGYEFEGVGAEAVSRGGAMIADSDDWTAMYWNPGNIARATRGHKKDFGLEVFGGEAYGKDSNSLSSVPGAGPFSRQSLSSPFILGALGGAVPVGEKLGLGFGVYTPLLQGVDFTDNSPVTGQHMHYEGSAGIVTMNFSASYAFVPKFSLGAGVNLLYGRLTQHVVITNYLLPGNVTESHLRGDGMGLEGTLGFRYDPHPKISIGGVYRSGSDVTLRGDADVSNSSPFPPIIPGKESSRFRFDLRHPPTAGLGIAVRPTARSTYSFDVNRTFWGRFSNAIQYNTPGALLMDTSNTFDWSNTWKLRFGGKWGVSDKTDLFAGYAYDTPALDARSVDLATSVDVYMSRFSTGFSHAWNDRWKSAFGILGGYGRRSENGVHYQLSGWQAMAETRVAFE